MKKVNLAEVEPEKLPERYKLFSDREREHIEKYEEKESQFSERPVFYQYNAAIRYKTLGAIDEIDWALDKFPCDQLKQVFTDKTILKLLRITEYALDASKWMPVDVEVARVHYETYSEKESMELIEVSRKREKQLKDHIIQLGKHFVHKELLEYIKKILDEPLIIAEKDELLYEKDKKIKALEKLMVQKGLHPELSEINRQLLPVPSEELIEIEKNIKEWKITAKEKPMDFETQSSYERSLSILLNILTPTEKGNVKPQELKDFVSKTREGMMVAISSDFQILLNLVEKVAENPTEKNLDSLKKAVLEYYIYLQE